jgi:hypothetical protein
MVRANAGAPIKIATPINQTVGGITTTGAVAARGDVLANGVSLQNHGRLRSQIGTCGSTMCSNRIPSAPRPAIAAVNELRDRKGEKRTKGNKIPFLRI